MNKLIIGLAVIGGLCVLCTLLFLIIGVVNSIRALKGSDHHDGT